jgi:hypothetical protein
MASSPVKRKKTKTWSGLTMTPAHHLQPESAESSNPPSPTQRFSLLSRSQSNVSNDERTPLLQNGARSRVRPQGAASATNSNGAPSLSRHHSFNGMLKPTDQLGLSPTFQKYFIRLTHAPLPRNRPYFEEP